LSEGGWRKLQNEGFHNIYVLPNSTKAGKAILMIWAANVARSIYENYTFFEKAEGKRPLKGGRLRVDERKLRRQIFKVYSSMLWAVLVRFRIRPKAGCCEHANQPSCFMNVEECVG
jgi:hypothetical protein